jgi:uncharacterized protein (TIGR03382 family)
MDTARRYWWIAGLGIAILVVIILAPLASGDPDGLEWVAGEHGFLDTAQDAMYSIIPDYAFPGVEDPALSTILAGVVGVILVFLSMIGLGWLLRRRRAA